MNLPGNATRENTLISLDELAAKINAEHEAAIETARTSIDHARQCGALLRRAKSQVGHGNFLTWLRDNCRVGERQARNYMTLDAGWDKLDKSAVNADLTISEAVERIQHAQQETARPNWKSLFTRQVTNADYGLPDQLPTDAILTAQTSTPGVPCVEVYPAKSSEGPMWYVVAYRRGYVDYTPHGQFNDDVGSAILRLGVGPLARQDWHRTPFDGGVPFFIQEDINDGGAGRRNLPEDYGLIQLSFSERERRQSLGLDPLDGPSK